MLRTHRVAESRQRHKYLSEVDARADALGRIAHVVAVERGVHTGLVKAVVLRIGLAAGHGVGQVCPGWGGRDV